MKNKFFTLIAAVSLLASCQDAYEITQPGDRTEESQVFINNAEIKRGINGLYATFNPEAEIEFVSYFTDELGLGITNAGQGVNDGSYTFFLQAGNSFATSAWGTYYNIINRGNRMLNRIDELKLETQSNTSLSNSDKVAALEALGDSRAEILALRAYCNLKLFSYFTPDYTNPSGLSVIKFDFLQTDNYARFESRATVQEMVDFIVSDVNEALSNTNGVSPTGGKIKASNNFLKTILVKLYAMTEDYDKVELYANELSADYSLMEASSGMYQLMFADDVSNGELIFALQRMINESNSVAAAWYSDAISIDATQIYMEVGRSLYNQLDRLDPSKTNQVRDLPNFETRNDARYEINVLTGSKVATNYSSLSIDQYRTQDVLLVGKYTGRTQSPLQNNVIIFRYADVLLSLAEAKASQGDIAGVEAIIRQIRTARSYTSTPASMPVINSVQSAWKAILDERRVEFAFEGYRYLDMKRLGSKAGSPGFVRDPQDCATTNVCELTIPSHKLTLPIPRTEILANPAISNQQNPGY